MDASTYCHELERYLCQKNEGHLIRIVGPAFEKVCGWAEQGVPLAVARQGIDQYCERYYAKGPRRRPVRIEFCEADVLELFDAWRRAVGVTAVGGEGAEERRSRQDSLPAHIDRAIARLTVLRAGSNRSRALADALADAVRALDTMRAAAKRARGSDRSALLEQLARIDRDLRGAAVGDLDDARRAAVQAEAEAEVAPFAARMAPDARAQAVAAAFERLVCDELGLPGVAFE